MVNFTDGQVLAATVATTSETSLGTINIPSGRAYQITNLWCAGTGGTFRAAADILPSMQGVRIQNSTDPTNIGANIKYDESILLTGPSELTIYISNSAATSTACKCVVEYVDMGGQ